MLFGLGRFLQLVGLVLLPVAIAGNLANERLNLKESLELSGVGMLLFGVGWVLQEASRRK